MKKFLLALILLHIVSCAHKEITSKDFTKDKTVVVAKFNLIYSGSKVAIDSGIWNNCNVYLSHENKRSKFSAIKNDYVAVIMNDDIDEVKLEGLNCSSYRIIYAKYRNYVPQSPLVFKITPRMVNYIGDIDLVWDSQFYLSRVEDYINLGFQNGFNTRFFDEGEAELKVSNKFKEAKNHMMQQFKIDNYSIFDNSRNGLIIKNQ